MLNCNKEAKMCQKEVKKELILQKETVSQLDHQEPGNPKIIPSGPFSYCCPSLNQMGELCG